MPLGQRCTQGAIVETFCKLYQLFILYKDELALWEKRKKEMAEQSLKDKTVKGTLWSGIDNVAQYVVSFFVSIVLARLLSPDDYGLLGIVAIFTAVCQTVINGGFTTALVRKKDANDDDYSNYRDIFRENMDLQLKKKEEERITRAKPNEEYVDDRKRKIQERRKRNNKI